MKYKANWDFVTEVKFMGYNKHGYVGAFPDNVEKDILSLVKNPCLHLFSGSSLIGDTRVDIAHENATNKCDVFDYLQTFQIQKQWEWCLLDPPYNIHNPSQDLKEYKIYSSVSCSVPKRQALARFFKKFCKNVLWLDYCAPLPPGFIREKVWFYFPGGYRTIRILSWLKII